MHSIFWHKKKTNDLFKKTHTRGSDTSKAIKGTLPMPKHHTTRTHLGLEVKLHAFFTSELDGDAQ